MKTINLLFYCLFIIYSSVARADFFDNFTSFFTGSESKESQLSDMAILSHNEMDNLRIKAEENQDMLTKIYLDKIKVLKEEKDNFFTKDDITNYAKNLYLKNFRTNMKNVYDEYQKSLADLNHQVSQHIDNKNNNTSDVISLYSDSYILPKKSDGTFILEGDSIAADNYCINKGFNSGKILSEKELYYKCSTLNNIVCDGEVSCGSRFSKKGMNIYVHNERNTFVCSPVLFGENSKMRKLNLNDTRKAHEILDSFEDFNSFPELSYYFGHGYKNQTRYELSEGLYLQVAFDLMDEVGTELFATKLLHDEYGNYIGNQFLSTTGPRGAHIFYNPTKERYVEYKFVQEMVEWSKQTGKDILESSFYNPNGFQTDFYSISIKSLYLKTTDKIVSKIKCTKEQSIGQKLETKQANINEQLNAINEKYKSQMHSFGASTKSNRTTER